jgi:DNA-binding MarR family transcriptional regulator/DNA-binding NarL/FixJ family response regulator
MEPGDSYRSTRSILLFADDPADLADHARLVRSMEGRLALTAPLAQAMEQLDATVDVGIVIVAARQDSGAELDRLLDRLNLAARDGRHLSIVSVAPALIDVAAARAPDPGVTLLSEPTQPELVAAVALALAELEPVPARAEENVTARLHSLSEEVGRIAKTLAALSSEIGPSRSAHAGPIADEDLPPVTAKQIRTTIRARRLREQYFAADLFADPAWDMLLDLAASRLEGRRVAVSSLCIAAAVPPTTALRWIKTLTDEGLFVRLADPDDGRRVFIELSEPAAAGVTAYFRALGRLALGMAAS